ncbi:16S rRNA (cytosine(967)-C(5))-methyltransferase RsmB [Photobacterium kishitanii]|uniref:Ribosomal RNA small subunit methyltransferase B n=1 Tax=Photobacterium kishitanii TaxID=318456 RepID=A0A0B7J6R3_9GAMM|nr:16S rRNA (cytosine(967)-C(5))-methyltransferase RsmB [Photobacterium kishitanii]PSU88364.1 16S rRNA (cytosine(967)-C(5))-methyltransferase RsmB [Photobacterium kishitanii]PSU90023.1 16S rRNA (cytosine(967)-C(5))-methyltransferase RsmB [Photobacterium kishitanii]PSV17573.1 16S rRNA (cytosine(967)-C(5))-methyltransferase RsmB [Photobacterium kishitanii]CEO37664.1 16S rRNA m5C967 methyltransferase,S-adenosyl-L-methionine-dependent [Photobacterium kishitanii]
MNVRAAAAKVIYQVVDQGQSLSAALPLAQQNIRERDHALLQEICYGVLRWLPRLESITQALMEKPLTGKQRVFHHLILVGLYQLGYMRIPAHAAVAETVDATKTLKKPQLRGLINAILRSYQRQKETLDEQAISHDAGKYGHPSWLLKLLKASYPDQYAAICEANNTKAPMWLRVNSHHHDRDTYRALLDAEGIATELHPQAADALRLISPCDVTKLPGFSDGWVSVQDAAAQLAVDYLQPQAGELILDCCAAPGGKTVHIMERVPSAQVVAIDCDENRLKRVYENLERLHLSAQVLCADARYPDQWWHGEKFDRILLDAPCSATGVIRRHPDIKWLRRGEDIAALALLQAEIFDAMWLQLKPGGTLVYATCSITPQENCDQVKAFLSRTADATLIDSDPASPGRQILPGEDAMDGFYYAVLTKSN